MFKNRSKKPILLIQHAEHEHPAAMRRCLVSQGIETIWVHPYRSEEYPKLGEIGGLISFGGPMSANDVKEHPWIRDEEALIRASVEAGKPTVGICLGGQIMAKALGGAVESNLIAEVGWFPVFLNEEGAKDPVLGAAGATPTVYHWHEDTFHLPKGALHLGSSRACARQAYRIGDHAYGFQFHPEADHQIVLEWLALEGMTEEIERTQQTHGRKTVQDIKTQRNHALKGEKGSLKITAAVGGLFRGGEPGFSSVNREKIDGWVAHQTRIGIELKGSFGKNLLLRGTIASILSIPAGDFVIFQDENGLLWPIRLEDIIRCSLLG